ncbi:biotin--[acetyl-CoA-carboxylase] ligase [Eubacteriaceae bacterium ES3]|nr:biotin--[acetyl-CoA-carboxylase] ligase [Eubacteriaceae bacterium ES3]
MSTKAEILKILENNREKSVSGEALANMLNISRTAVWKGIKALKEEGYAIESVTRKGYCLKSESDLLSAEGIKIGLNDPSIKLTVLKTTESTNKEAKARVLSGASHKMVILSEEQTGGKGRMGRSFFSPNHTGIYMSLVLKPDLLAADAVLTTAGAAVGVCRGIKKATGMETQIKWVNDIFFENKKVCGILTEAGTDFESGTLSYLIIGIGINVFAPEGAFPTEISKIAGSLFDHKPEALTRNQLAAEIINEVFDICNNLNNHSFIEEYKKRSMIIGEEVDVIRRNQENQEAKVLDIDENGGLVVEYKNKTKQTLHSGEISIRKKER